MNNAITLIFIPLLVFGTLLASIILKKPAYSSFIKGSREGLGLITEVFPSLLAMLLAVTLLESCGILDDISSLLSRAIPNIKLFSDLTPMVIFRPISGSASTAVLNNICSRGADSLACKMAATIQGSTDTTLYVLALYFSSVGITKWRHALKSGLIADVAGMGLAIILALLFLH